MMPIVFAWRKFYNVFELDDKSKIMLRAQEFCTHKRVKLESIIDFMGKLLLIK